MNDAIKGFKTKKGIKLYDYNSLANRPEFKTINGINITGAGNISLTVDPVIMSQYAKKSELFSRSYNDLTDKPTGMATEEWVLNKKYLIKHDISHLAEKSELFSKSYNDLTDTPIIPSLNGYATEQWVEDKKYLTEHQPLDDYATIEWVENKKYLTEQNISHLAPTSYVDNKVSSLVDSAPEALNTLKELSTALGNDVNFATTIAGEIGKKLNKSDFQTFLNDVASSYAKKSELFSKSYNDLTDTPADLATMTWVRNQKYLTEHQSLNGYATEQWVENKKYLTKQNISHLAEKSELQDLSNNINITLDNYYQKQDTLSKDEIISEINKIDVSDQLVDYALKSELFSKSYNDLTDKPTIPSIDGLASENYVDTKVAALIDSAPENLNTLKELADAFKNNSDVLDVLNQSIGSKADKTELFSKSYNDLTNKPEIPSIEGLASESWVISQKYLTEHQSLNGYATEQWVLDKNYLTTHQNISHLAPFTYVDEKIADIVDLENRPEGLINKEYLQEKTNIKKIKTIRDFSNSNFPNDFPFAYKRMTSVYDQDTDICYFFGGSIANKDICILDCKTFEYQILKDILPNFVSYATGQVKDNKLYIFASRNNVDLGQENNPAEGIYILDCDSLKLENINIPVDCSFLGKIDSIIMNQDEICIYTGTYVYSLRLSDNTLLKRGKYQQQETSTNNWVNISLGNGNSFFIKVFQHTDYNRDLILVYGNTDSISVWEMDYGNRLTKRVIYDDIANLSLDNTLIEYYNNDIFLFGGINGDTSPNNIFRKIDLENGEIVDLFELSIPIRFGTSFINLYNDLVVFTEPLTDSYPEYLYTLFISLDNLNLESEYMNFEKSFKRFNEISKDIKSIQSNIDDTSKNIIEWIEGQKYLTDQNISHLAPISYVDGKVADLVGSTPEVLDTLQELSAALGNDSNFATTISGEIGKKISRDDAIQLITSYAHSKDDTIDLIDASKTTILNQISITLEDKVDTSVVTNLQQSVTQSLNNINLNIENMDERLYSLNSTVSTLNDDVATLKNNVSTINENINNIEKDININTEWINGIGQTLDESMEEIKPKITDIESSISQHQQWMDGTDQKMSDIESTINTTNSTIETHRQNINNNTNWISGTGQALDEFMEEIKPKITSVESSISQHQQQLTNHQNWINSVGSEIEKIEKHQQWIDDTDQVFDEFDSAISALKDENNTLKKKLVISQSVLSYIKCSQMKKHTFVNNDCQICGEHVHNRDKFQIHNDEIICTCGYKLSCYCDPTILNDFPTDHECDFDAHDRCIYCGVLNPEHIHKFVNGICVICEVEEEHVHEYQEDFYNHRRCLKCGEIHIHEFIDKVCRLCGYRTYDNIEHIHIYGDDGICEICGKHRGFDFILSGDTVMLTNGSSYDQPALVITGTYQGKEVSGVAGAAFKNNTKITNVEISDSVLFIAEEAFYGCTSLESVELPPNLDSIQAATFYGCSSLETINIPDSVDTIGISAFRDCTSLEAVYMPNNVTNIYENAFAGCSNLYSINLSTNIKKINNNTFEGCSALEEINIPNGVTEIGTGAFVECDSLSVVWLPNSLTTIGDGAFYGCDSLRTIDIPNNVSSIGAEAFSACTNLETIKIHNEAFYEEVIENRIALGINETATITLVQN